MAAPDRSISDGRTVIGWALLVLSAGMLTGCGYTVGAAFAPDIRTVSVPIFTNDGYRRGFEYQLTEAVQREIQSSTPLRLVKSPQADTRLTGRIISIEKEVLAETSFDDPRQLQFAIAVEVVWEDLRSGEILAQRQLALSPETVLLVGRSEFAPEVGQSLATATQVAVDDLATQIVEMMETPW